MTDALKATRQFRRLRSQFKKDLGLETLTRADRSLIDSAALLALRAQQMRDAVLAGVTSVSDEDIVRSINASVRVMKALRTKDRPAQPKSESTQRVFNEDDF